MPNFVQSALNAFAAQHQGSDLTETEQNYIDVIKNNDSQRGEQLAMNLCRSMGMTKEQAITQARKFFGI